MRTTSRSSTTISLLHNPHPGEILMEEFLKPMTLSQTALANAIGVPPRRINEIVLGKRAISADTAMRLGRYFGNVAFPGQVGTGWPKETRHLRLAQFWLDLQSQYDIAVVEREKGGEIAKRVRPAFPPW